MSTVRARTAALPTNGGATVRSEVSTAAWDLTTAQINRIPRSGANGGAKNVRASLRFGTLPETGAGSLLVDLRADRVQGGPADSKAKLESVALYQATPRGTFEKVGEGFRPESGYPQQGGNVGQDTWSGAFAINEIGGRVKAGHEYLAVVTVRLNDAAKPLQIRTAVESSGPELKAASSHPGHLATEGRTLSQAELDRIPTSGDQTAFKAKDITPTLEVRPRPEGTGTPQAIVKLSASVVRLNLRGFADARVSSAALYRAPTQAGGVYEKVGEQLRPHRNLIDPLDAYELGGPPITWTGQVDLSDLAFRTKPGEKYVAVLTVHMNGERGPGLLLRTPLITAETKTER